MLPTTSDLVRLALKGDPTIQPRLRGPALSQLRKFVSGEEPTCPPTRETKIVRRARVAELLSGSLRLVDKLAEQGVLQKVKLPGRKRAVGFRERDILALIEGRQTTPSADAKACAGSARDQEAA